ncbi:MAG TPA: thiol peroxidase [Verrucomicrobia bacterium]|nr:thiol peroxidase [Verrucomicrobiota bacterium]
MAQVTFKGNPVKVSGKIPAVGAAAPVFKLTGTDLGDVSLSDFAGRNVVLNIFPSIDTPVCATSVRQFNTLAGKIADTVVLCVSVDLPFAQGRFCGAEGLTNVKPVSAFRSPSFGTDFGVLLSEGPLAGLYARAVVIIGKTGKVVYTQLVPEIAQEPDYQAALKALGA